MTKAIPVPSGQSVTLMEIVDDGPVRRFRFLAPAIADAVDFDAASADITALCDGFARAQIAGSDAAPQQIVISLSDRPVPFGETDPAATQFFEAFSLDDGHCIWEPF